MFKFIAERKWKKVWWEIMYFEGDDWNKMKHLLVEGFILGCMVDYGSHHDPGWACIQALEAVKKYREWYLMALPFEYYADLVCAFKDKVSQLPQHYKDTAAKLEQLAVEMEDASWRF